MTTWEYLTGEETNLRRELTFGTLVREPAPTPGHQGVIMNIAAALFWHVKVNDLGFVCTSPVDVVFDEARNLVLQPDLIFVSGERSHIVRDRVWGAPDLIVEVLSPGNTRRDREDKRGWYADYGVREYWIVDDAEARIEVLGFERRNESQETFEGHTPIRSRVLPGLDLRAIDVFRR